MDNLEAAESQAEHQQKETTRKANRMDTDKQPAPGSCRQTVLQKYQWLSTNRHF